MPRHDVFLEHFDLSHDVLVSSALKTSFVLNHNTFNIGVPVIKWTNKGGFDGYDKSRSAIETLNRKTGRVRKKVIKGRRYGTRENGCHDISQIMIHHTGGDGNGGGRVFNTLHMQRGLSVHFVVDDDGMIYQFLDCKEKAWHAGKHNKMSIGIECNLYPLVDKKPDYYSKARCRRNGNQPHVVGVDEIHGVRMNVFKFTKMQVKTLARLCAGLWVALNLTERGSLNMDTASRFFSLASPPVFPRTHGGAIAKTVVSRPTDHIGLIGHLQATRRKIDPAGFPWQYFEKKVSQLYKEFIENQKH